LPAVVFPKMEMLDLIHDYDDFRSPSPQSIRSEADSIAELTSANMVRNAVMINFLRQQQLKKLWSDRNLAEGVVLKRSKGDFICQPEELSSLTDGFYDQVKRLNVKVCYSLLLALLWLNFQVSMTMKTSVIQTFLGSSNLPFVPWSDGLRLQVIPNVLFLSRCQKHHFAAFIQDSGMLVVWDDDPEHIVDRAEQIEQHLVGMIWRSEGMKDDGDYKTALAKSTFTSRTPTININAMETLEADRQFSDKPRRVLLFQPILMAITGIVVVLTIGVGWRKIAIELKVDHRYMRCLLIVVVPLQIWLGWVSHGRIIR
jgi:hypothetical protein